MRQFIIKVRNDGNVLVGEDECFVWSQYHFADGVETPDRALLALAMFLGYDPTVIFYYDVLFGNI